MSAHLHARLAFTGICVFCASLSAGGLFIFPLIAPSIAVRLDVSQVDLTPVALAGLMGQYLFAPGWGALMDRVGTWACSLSASVLFALGYGLLEYTIYLYSKDQISAPAAIGWLVFLNFLVGLGTVASYFAFLFASCKNFPRSSGLAIGLPMALFGISPLVLSSIASHFFVDPSTGLLDSSRFLRFLAVLTGSINALGFFGLRVWREEEKGENPITHAEPVNSHSANDTSENTPLLSTPDEVQCSEDQSVWALLSDIHFWALLLIVLVTTGACEMVMANIGIIVLALMPDRDSSPPPATVAAYVARSPLPSLAVRRLHVQLISIFNTCSRIVAGVLADRYATADGTRRAFVSRAVFVFGGAAVLAVAFGWTAWGLATEKSLWVLSTAVGAGYGTIFTVGPSITSSVWGPRNLGRNWGILSYAPLIGTPVFTFLYTVLSNRATKDRACEGARCFRPTFATCSVVAVAAACGSLLLMRKWRGVL